MNTNKAELLPLKFSQYFDEQNEESLDPIVISEKNCILQLQEPNDNQSIGDSHSPSAKHSKLHG